jgi:ABC-2 type transport system ATP-binding protein
MSIEVKNLLKVYGDQKAVNNISFKVDKAEIVGFLGPNGAGKSTTMKIITGYLQQTMAMPLYLGISVTQNLWLQKRKLAICQSQMLFITTCMSGVCEFIAEVHHVKFKT